ncbi:MAG: oligosaccharide flippase family protein, partial [Clostridia bacterium]|nr:oligosaccharide flippase family protein [Clostridia bacterium]
VFTVIGIISAAVGVILAFNADYFFAESLTSDELAKGKILMLILSFNIGMTFKYSIYGNIIIACERFVFSKLISIVRTLLAPMIMVPILLLGGDSIWLVSVTCAVNVGCLLSNRYYAKRKLGIKAKFCGVDRNTVREIFTFSFFIFLAQIVDKVNWGVDQFILGMFLGTEEVAVYSYAANYNQFILLLSATLSGIMLPKITAMLETGAQNKDISREFIKFSRLQLYPILLATAAFALVGKSFVMWHGGPDYENSFYVALILIISEVIPITQSVALATIKAKKKLAFWSYMTLATAMANIVISIPLAIRFGSVGSAIGTAITFMCANVVIMNIYYHKKIGIDIPRYWIELIRMVLGILPAIVITYILKILFPISGIGEFFVYAPVFVILFCICAVTIVMNEYEKDILRAIIKKITRRLK